MGLDTAILAGQGAASGSHKTAKAFALGDPSGLLARVLEEGVRGGPHPFQLACQGPASARMDRAGDGQFPSLYPTLELMPDGKKQIGL